MQVISTNNNISAATVVDFEAAAQTIRCKSDLYYSLVRNRFFLPPLRDPMNTKYFLQGVLDGHYYCFHSDHLTGLIPVADPPSKEVLSLLLGDRMLDMIEMRP